MIETFLGGLESLFAWLLEASWQASVLVALVLLLQMAMRQRLNPRWHHALWLLVIARLLLPVLPESALSLFQFAPPSPQLVTETMTEPIFEAPSAPMIAAPPFVAHVVAHHFSAFTALALVWLLGALGLLILTSRVNRRFARHMAAAPQVSDLHLLKLAEAAQRELGLHRRLRMIESSQVQSPAIMGLFHATLILPSEIRSRFSDDELRFIFLHEFAHLKRGDIVLLWIVAGLQILHWFNPVLWYAFRRMRADREPATDALVLSRAGEGDKDSYGHVLLKLLDHYHQRHSLSTLVGILEDKDQFKRRFTLITKFTGSAYGWSLLGLVTMIALAVVGLTGKAAEKIPAPAVSVADQRLDELHNQLRIGNLNTVDMPLDQFIEKISKEFVAQDPQKLGLGFVLRVPPGESPLRLSLDFARDPGYRANAQMILAFVKNKYPIRYRFDGTTVYVQQLSKSEIAFHKKAKETLISLDFDHTEASSALAAIQSAAAAKGFIFDLKGLDTIRTLNAMKPEPKNLVTLEADPLSVDQALRSVFYLGKISPVPLEPFSGYTVYPNSDDAVQKQTFLEVRTNIERVWDSVTETAKGQKVIQMKMEGMASPILTLNAFSNGEHSLGASISLDVEGAKPTDKCALTFTIKPEIVDKRIIQATGLVELKDSRGNKIDGFAGQWKQASGVSAYLEPDGGRPAVAFPAPLSEDSLSAGTEVNQGYDLSVTATLVDPDGMPLLPPPPKEGPSYQTVSMASSAGPPPDPFRFHASNTGLQNEIDWGGKNLARDVQNYQFKVTPQEMAEALGTGREDIAQIFWDHGSRDCSDLCLAVSQGKPPAELEALIKTDTANPPQDRFITPLAVAAETGNLDAVRLLLENGADPNRGETAHFRPLGRAAAIIRPDMVDYLLQKGARPESTVLFTTIGSAGNPASQPYLPALEKIAKLMIDAGSVKGISEFESYILLTDASYTAKNPAMLQLLLDAGLRPSSKGDKGKTVIEFVREAYDHRETEGWNHGLKHILEILEAADKGAASKADADSSGLEASVPPAAAFQTPPARTAQETGQRAFVQVALRAFLEIP
jgi:beta-lactamase regulating signal transducer with metallopeptidase domain